jgi:hypothetical protein
MSGHGKTISPSAGGSAYRDAAEAHLRGAGPPPLTHLGNRVCIAAVTPARLRDLAVLFAILREIGSRPVTEELAPVSTSAFNAGLSRPRGTCSAAKQHF